VIELAFMMLQTPGFTALPEEVKARIMAHALKRINVKTDMIAYYPGKVGERLEDGGRTMITGVRGLDRKVYVKLDDFGDPGRWGEMYDPETVGSLKQAPGCRFTVTFMLADEY
jgi:hypothetical protein